MNERVREGEGSLYVFFSIIDPCNLGEIRKFSMDFKVERDVMEQVREENELIDEMLELEAHFGPFSVPRRYITDRINPLEHYSNLEFRFDVQ